MAEFNRKENPTLNLEIDVMQRLRKQGMVGHGPQALNSDLGVLLVKITISLGEKQLIEREVMVFSSSIKDWCNKVEKLVLDDRLEQKSVSIDEMMSPALILNVMRFDFTRQTKPDDPSTVEKHTYYHMVAAVDSGFLELDMNGEDAVSGEGPGLFLRPDAEELLTFARDLRSEVEMTELLSPD